MTKIRNTRNSLCWQGCGARGTLLHCWWECKLVQPLWKSIWQFLRKLEIVLPEDPAIPLLGIYPEDVPPSHKDICSTMLSSFIHNKQKLETTQIPSTKEWRQKMWLIYTRTTTHPLKTRISRISHANG